ncbi:CRTAC1 family protein [Rhizobium sp. PAMB 3174]
MKKTAFYAGLAALGLFQPSIAAEDAKPEAPFYGDIPQFHEEALAAGIDHEYTGPWEYFVGGGVASFDCNGDRTPDLVLAGGTSPTKLYVNRSPVGGAFAFEKRSLGLSERDEKSVLGVYPVDIDNDRHIDLVLLRLGENIVLKGGPNCSFEKANRAFAFDGGRDWSTAFAATWETGSRFPTLAIGNYVDRSAPGSPFGTCSDNRLLRPKEGDKPDYSDGFALRPSYCTLSMLFTDWNRSGKASLRVTNDRQYYRGGQEQLWELPDGHPPRQYTTAQGWQALKIWGMGIAEADLNADGLPEYALTSMGDTMLQTLDDEAEEDRPTYRDIAYEKGSTAYRPYTGGDRRPSTGWHSEFADVNNDTNLDLFIAKGNVEVMPDFANFDPDNLLLGGFDGKFHERGGEAGIALNTKGRGAVLEDFNNDGMLDLLVVNRSQKASLFRNMGAKTDWGYRPLGNWTEIELDNGKVNPFAVGAKINVRAGTLTQVRTVQVGGGHASGRLGFTHFGLGVNERAVIRVQWPDGEWSAPYRVFANQHVVIRRGAAGAQYWFPVSNAH